MPSTAREPRIAQLNDESPAPLCPRALGGGPYGASGVARRSFKSVCALARGNRLEGAGAEWAAVESLAWVEGGFASKFGALYGHEERQNGGREGGRVWVSVADIYYTHTRVHAHA